MPTHTLTHTLTQTFTATPAFTPTLAIPLISVSTATNCRSGPGKVYDMKGALLVGEFAEVYGRDPGNNYWYIRNPHPGSEFCWVWGKYATIIGPTLLLPILTPPPTPTPTFTPTPFPDFQARYIRLDKCNGKWWVEIRLKNNGALPLKSMSISVRDKVTGKIFTDITDGFTNKDGCLAKTTKDILASGATYMLSGPVFNYELTGHRLKVTITLCSSKCQKGMCITKTLEFKP